MRLHVSFDDSLIKKYVERGSSPLFTIYWTHEGMAYPEDQWMDFGSVILSWWLVAARSLLESAAKADFLFMDGPYCLEIRRVNDRVYVSAEDSSVQWQISTEDFAAELLRVADTIQKKFAELGISDKEGLEIGVQKLKNALAQGSRSGTRPVLVSHAG